MAKISLRSTRELSACIDRTLARLIPQLRALLPGAELHHVGATALPEAVTKGDLDILVRVPEAGFSEATETLKSHFSTKQPENWTHEFASFGDDTAYEVPVGVQLLVKDCEQDFMLFIRDYLAANPSAVAGYNRLKFDHAGDSGDGYWRAKDAFFSKILALRKG